VSDPVHDSSRTTLKPLFDQRNGLLEYAVVHYCKQQRTGKRIVVGLYIMGPDAILRLR